MGLETCHECIVVGGCVGNDVKVPSDSRGVSWCDTVGIAMRVCAKGVCDCKLEALVFDMLATLSMCAMPEGYFPIAL